MGLFRDWGITNISLKRKVKRKIKSKKLKKRNEPADYTGRKYEDYINFISEHPNVPTTEMDTVYNNTEGPYIQTFIFEHTGLMIGVLHSEKTADSMASALDIFQEKLENDYYKLFENNHNFVREILPNGMSWAKLTQEKVDLMFSHINSVPRDSLGGKTPYEAFSFFYGSEILNKLNIQKIEKDRVTLKPYLLKLK